jgi:SAM-dependent methyltransferase
MRGSSDFPDAGARGVDAEIGPLHDAVSPAVEEALLATVRELASSTPASRHDPFYGLDRRGGPSLRLLDRLTRHGDFRKYVIVLDVGAGLGGAARWLALRYGCRVVMLERSPRLSAVSARLVRRARLAGRVHAVAGSFAEVPARDGMFTQIWSVESLQHATNLHNAVAELYRVLRPGSTLALQEIVRRDDSVPAIGGIWRHGTAAGYVDALGAVGFKDILQEDVTVERAERSSIVLSAATRFEHVLSTRIAADDPWHRATAELRRVQGIIEGPAYRVVHFFARRPSI